MAANLMADVVRMYVDSITLSHSIINNINRASIYQLLGGWQPSLDANSNWQAISVDGNN